MFYDDEEPGAVAVVAATQITATERCCFVPLAQCSAFKQQLQHARDGIAAAKAAAAAAAAATDAERQAAADAAKGVSKDVVQPLYAEWLPAVQAAGFACGSAVAASGADYELRVHELTTHALLGAYFTSTKTHHSVCTGFT